MHKFKKGDWVCCGVSGDYESRARFGKVWFVLGLSKEGVKTEVTNIVLSGEKYVYVKFFNEKGNLKRKPEGVREFMLSFTNSKEELKWKREMEEMCIRMRFSSTGNGSLK